MLDVLTVHEKVVNIDDRVNQDYKEVEKDQDFNEHSAKEVDYIKVFFYEDNEEVEVVAISVNRVNVLVVEVRVHTKNHFVDSEDEVRGINKIDCIKVHPAVEVIVVVDGQKR